MTTKGSNGDKRATGKPLQGVLVVDFTRLYPGPLATLLLGDMGATVIKIEDEEKPDMLRSFAPIASDGVSISYHALNRGKLSLSLHLRRQESRSVILRLLEHAAVLVESFRPGVIEAILGFQHIEELCARFPNLIVARINAFGSGDSVPQFYKAIPAHDMNSLARAGVLHLQKQVNGPLPIQVVDLLTGWSCCAQVCAALVQRKGTVIDVSMYDNALGSIVMQASKALSTAANVSHGVDILIGSVPCYNIYKTKQGYLSVGCLEPHFWSSLMIGLGLPQYATVNYAFAQGKLRDELMLKIEQALSTKSAREWEDIFISDERGNHGKLPIIALRQVEESLKSDELLQLRNMTSTFQVEGGQTVTVMQPGLDYVSFLKKSGEEKPTGASKLGEHNNFIAQHFLSSKL